MSEPLNRDAALVLSGGGINGVLLELGFLKRLRETPFWSRVGWIYGTSAGALAGTMGALDRLDDLETFLLALRSDEVFRPRRMWQLPLGGLRDYALPETIATRLGPADEIGTGLANSEIELVVFATDVSEHLSSDITRNFELVFSSRTASPGVMARATFASAAISALVLPIPIGDVIATDGGWVRNFPLEHAETNPAVSAVAAFRYLATYRPLDVSFLERIRERLGRFRAIAPIRGILEEIQLAEERARRGEPAHYPELIIRLMRVTVARNTVVEEQLSNERAASATEIHRLRHEVIEAAVRAAPSRHRQGLREELEALFSAARFPFRTDRTIDRLIVRAAPGEGGLDPTYRGEWDETTKRALIELGYRLTDEALTDAPHFLEPPG
ncbi:MAG: patatin-like phospholipase family protein [Actinobacteria bacterium]|nr:patatin-like phospholipase family protein [Actinomycetota bacterium]